MHDDDASPTPATDRVTIRSLRPTEWYRLRSNPLRIPVTLMGCEVSKYFPITAKNALYRRMGVTVGEGTVLAPHVQVDPFFPEKLTIGTDSLVGWGTKLFTHEAYTDEWHVGPVEIGDEVVVGHGCSTRPGVRIGDGATVGANSFIDRDVASGARVGGTPIEPL